jgi:hypothetical protein
MVECFFVKFSDYRLYIPKYNLCRVKNIEVTSPYSVDDIWFYSVVLSDFLPWQN